MAFKPAKEAVSEEAVEQTVDLSDALRAGSIVVQPAPIVRLTPEIRAALRVPIPANKLLTVDKGARGVYKYADEDYLKSRLSDVDPDWELHYEASGSVMTCHITLCGVTRGATAGIDGPTALRHPKGHAQQFQVVRTPDGQPILLTVGERGYVDEHLRASKAQSASFRRACAEHELGAELWPSKLQAESETATQEYIDNTPVQRAQAQYPQSQSARTAAPRAAQAPAPVAAGTHRYAIAPQRGPSMQEPASPGQRKFLGDLGVPEYIIDQLNKYGGKTSEVGLILEGLKATREQVGQEIYAANQNKYWREAVEIVCSERAMDHQVNFLGGSSNGSNDDFDPFLDDDDQF